MGSADVDPSIGIPGASGMAKAAQLGHSGGQGVWLKGLQQKCSVWWGKARVCTFPKFLSCCRLLISCVPSTARSMGSCAGQTRLGQSMTG